MYQMRLVAPILQIPVIASDAHLFTLAGAPRHRAQHNHMSPNLMVQLDIGMARTRRIQTTQKADRANRSTDHNAKPQNARTPRKRIRQQRFHCQA